ncbi:hypothetical protein [Nostoc sp. FACHB-133]|nr:hypothetical protein [Nostoc sp. FACHB-133]MBD2527975.1 hypothetical protein [Nostoc sp. FACHB-133]
MRRFYLRSEIETLKVMLIFQILKLKLASDRYGYQPKKERGYKSYATEK